MPIYEYRCDECSEVFEAIQRVADEPLDSCRHCGGRAKRIVSSPAIHFVGAGWYVTDYARKGRNGKGDGDRGEASAAGERAEGGAAGSSSEKGGAADSSSPNAAEKGGDRGSARAAGGSGGAGTGSSGRSGRTASRAGAAS